MGWLYNIRTAAGHVGQFLLAPQVASIEDQLTTIEECVTQLARIRKDMEILMGTPQATAWDASGLGRRLYLVPPVGGYSDPNGLLAGR